MVDTELDKLIKKVNPKLKKPIVDHRIVYDSSTETLEPLYFWILDFMSDLFKGDMEKLIDNFSSSPGSGHFSDLQGKAAQMQQEASRVLGTVNNILKGVLNLIYDLKEFKIRLSHYEAADSKDKLKAEAGLLALKQIWMDKVDIQRGQGSINAMASGNLQFVTLRDAFMAVNSIKDIDNLDLNDRVKRILKPRVQEFFEWRKRSEAELRKRFEVEKIYLKSQVEALKLNARWAKPYLRAAQRLTSHEGLATKPELVTAFNTLLLELAIMGKSRIKVEQEVVDKKLPPGFERLALKKKVRDYYAIVFVDFKFRGIPSKAGQHYVFGGRVEAHFKGYGLNEDEIEELRYQLSESDLESSLKFVEGMTDESLSQIKVDIHELLGNDKEEEKRKKQENINPFAALFSIFRSSEKKEKKEEKSDEELHEEREKRIKKESYAEKYLRNLAEVEAVAKCFRVFDIYKKGHGMASFPYGGGEKDLKPPRTTTDKLFAFKD